MVDARQWVRPGAAAAGSESNALADPEWSADPDNHGATTASRPTGFAFIRSVVNPAIEHRTYTVAHAECTEGPGTAATTDTATGTTNDTANERMAAIL